MDDATQTVELNLEESGILCHLMMGEKQFREYVFTGRVTAQAGSYLSDAQAREVLQRWAMLYNKLAAANDKLMGKT